MSTHSRHDDTVIHTEHSDIQIGPIAKFVIGLVVVTAIVHVIIYGSLVLLDRTQSVTTVDFPLAAGETRQPPAPRLQVTPRTDMRNLAESNREVLESYGWVDREQGIVRIPIDVAMRLTLERGLPAREATPAADAPAAPQAGNR